MIQSSNNPPKSARMPRLSEKEWEILKPLWSDGPMAARDIYRKIPQHHGWAYKTVKTMLARLVKKEALTYDQIGNSYLYRPVYTQDEMTHAATTSFIQRVFDGALNPFFAHFAENISEEEFQKLKHEVDRIEKEKSNDRGKQP